MNSNPFAVIYAIEEAIKKRNKIDFSFKSFDEERSQKALIEGIIQEHIQKAEPKVQRRVQSEFEGWGPLEDLIEDSSITEIIANGPKYLWYEKQGVLHQHHDCFSSPRSYENFINRLCQWSRVHYTMEKPMVDGNILNFRLHLLSEEITKSFPVLSLRRHPENPWTLESLEQSGWSGKKQIQTLIRLIEGRENFLVIGSTGSGKTSVLNACLQHLGENERAIIIEDTAELKAPNLASAKLLTRKDANNSLSEINQSELLRQTLRMRPDRIIMGEIRGPEAKDLLMALSTGHSGSFATMHASDPYQAILRLEMLIQLGAPYWSLDAIRNLIFLSLQKILVVGRGSTGQRQLEGIYALCSRESSGILIERVA